MNFKELCQQLRQESGISGTGPSTVVSQTGILAKIVDWVRDGWIAIQNEHEDWGFLRKSFSLTLISGTREYTAASASLSDWGTWDRSWLAIYTNSVNDQTKIPWMPYQPFAERYLIGPVVTGRPAVWTITPNGELSFWPMPDAGYTVSGFYFRTPQVLAADADDPLISVKYQRAIIYRALMSYAVHDEAVLQYEDSERQYRDWLALMQRDLLPRPDTEIGPLV